MSIRSVCAVLTAVVGLTISSVSAMDFGIGVKGGLNLAKTYGDDVLMGAMADVGLDIETKMLPGFAGGLAFQLKFAKHFAIQPEVLFSSKGIKANISMGDLLDDYDDYDDYSDYNYTVGQLGDDYPTGGLSLDGDGKLSIKYLEIPVLFQLLLPTSNDVFTTSICAGPAVAFRVGVSGEMFDVEIPDESIDDLKEILKVFDFGIAMGLGFGIKAGPGRITIDARYTLGLLSIYDYEGESDGLPEDKNMALSFMGGYMFEF